MKKTDKNVINKNNETIKRPNNNNSRNNKESTNKKINKFL